MQVPPRDDFDRVPLGASSASMYPGYSPADHIYGEAAAEYGAMIAEARRQGKQIERNPDGVEYVVGQSQLSLREQLDELRKSGEAAKGSSNTAAKPTRMEQNGDGEPMEGVEQSTEPDQLFIIDSNPTPLNVLQNTSDASSKAKNKANDKAKRRVSSQDGQWNAPADALEEGHKKKKVKTAEVESSHTDEPKPLLEEDDISAEVDARHKEKEERRKRKEEKKRKRESGSSQTEMVETPAKEPKAELPSKKKQKKSKVSEESDQTAEAKATEEQNSKKDKKKKKQRESTEPVSDAPVEDGSEKPKKKRKKESKNDDA